MHLSSSNLKRRILPPSLVLLMCSACEPEIVPDNPEGWQRDIEALRNDWLPRDKSISPEEESDILSALEDLEDRLPNLNHEKFVIEVAKIVTIADNLHTLAMPLQNRELFRGVPVWFHRFADGLYVVRAITEYKDVVGCRVLEIDGLNVQEILAAVNTLYARHVSGKRYRDASLIRSPQLLYTLELTNKPDSFTLTCDCPAEKNVSYAISETDDEISPLPAWFMLSSEASALMSIATHGVETVSQPNYLRDPDNPLIYDMEHDTGLLYIRYSSALIKDKRHFRELTREILRVVSKEKPRHIVVDLRYNSGGDLKIARSFFDKLYENGAAGPATHWSLLISGATGSAAIYHAAQIKSLLPEIQIFGEAVADRLDFWAEGGNVTLPSTKLMVHYSNGFHSYSRAPIGDRQEYLYMDLNIDSLEPDVTVVPTFEQFRLGEDPLLDAAIRSKAKI